jgi:hypothetical protein
MNTAISFTAYKSSLNPADPISRALHLQDSRRIILEAHAKEQLYYKCGSFMCWGAIADRDKYVQCPVLLEPDLS